MNSFVNFNKMEKLGTQTMELKFLYIYPKQIPIRKRYFIWLGPVWQGMVWNFLESQGPKCQQQLFISQRITTLI